MSPVKCPWNLDKFASLPVGRRPDITWLPLFGAIRFLPAVLFHASPTHILVWPYDSGGCSCLQCRPWVTNGYSKAAQPLARLVKDKYPGAKTIAATWCFTPGEWADLDQAVVAKAEDWKWVDGVLATLLVQAGGDSARQVYRDTHKPLFDVVGESHKLPSGRSTPGNRALLTFARIGTHDMFPWGAFGADPTPDGCQAAWNLVKRQSEGGWPYSEGIYDDINKVLFLQLPWSPDRPASEILREYVGFEFSPDVTDDVCGAIKALEGNHSLLRWIKGMLVDTLDRNPTRLEPPPRDPATEAAWETLKRVETKLTTSARNSWRWRILYLRALLDSELRKNGGRAATQCEEAFRELTEIYHAQKADPPAKPPVPGKDKSPVRLEE